MTRKEYLLKSIEAKHINNTNWAYSAFGYRGIGPDKYLDISNGVCKAKLFDNELIEDYDPTRPLLLDNDSFSLKAGDVINLHTDIKVTTVGMVLLNYFALVANFGNKLDFMDGIFQLKNIEGKVIPKELLDKGITVEEYGNFVNNMLHLESLAHLFVISATSKSVSAPPKIKEFRAKLIRDFDKKYGPEWKKDLTKIAEYESILKKYDDDYIKDDPTYGIMLSGKIVNQGRKKTKLSIGGLSDAFDPTADVTFIPESLEDGLPLNREALTALYNESREGSYARGKETQFGGVLYDIMVRVISNITIQQEDCGTKRGIEVELTKDMMSVYSNSYLAGTTKLVTESMLNTTQTLRSPTTCKAPKNKRCKYCMGRIIGEKEAGAGLLVTMVSDIITHIYMKKMHGGQLKVTDLEVKDLL